MNLLKSYRLKASSLLESVMAIAIISVCMFIATMVYIRLFNSDYNLTHYKAKQEVARLYYNMVKAQTIEEDSYSYDGFSITQEVSDYDNSIKKVVFVVTNGDKKKEYSYLIKAKGIED